MIALHGPVGLVERARALFDPIELRMYVAAIVGRTGLRAPFGANRSFALPFNQPVRLAHNDSKGRALLVNLQLFGGPPPISVMLTPSPDAGATNFFSPKNSVLNNVSRYILRPDEQLFATATAVGSTAVTAQEWY